MIFILYLQIISTRVCFSLFLQGQTLNRLSRAAQQRLDRVAEAGGYFYISAYFPIMPYAQKVPSKYALID